MPSAGHPRLSPKSSALQRLALAFLVPKAGLAGVAVLRAGSVALEKPVPGDGDLVGAVRVLFQDVARDVAGPVLDSQRFLRPYDRRKADQKEDDGKPRGQPLRGHDPTSTKMPGLLPRRLIRRISAWIITSSVT